MLLRRPLLGSLASGTKSRSAGHRPAAPRQTLSSNLSGAQRVPPPAGRTFVAPVRPGPPAGRLPYPWSWRSTERGDLYLENLKSKLKVWPESVGIRPPPKGAKLRSGKSKRATAAASAALVNPTSAELNDGVWKVLETINTILVGSPAAYWAVFVGASGFLVWFYYKNKPKKDESVATVELPGDD